MLNVASKPKHSHNKGLFTLLRTVIILDKQMTTLGWKVRKCLKA